MLHHRIRAAVTVARHFSAVALATEKEVAKAEAGQTTGGSGSGAKDTLGRRLFALVSPKRSAVVTIQKWRDEGHIVQKYELNRIVRELRRNKRYKHALEICEWMRTQEDIKLLPGDYAVHLDLIAKVRGLNSAEKFFIDLPEQMRGQHTCTAVLHIYVQNNVYDKAEALMEKMSESGYLKCPLPFNHMMSLYMANGQLEKIPGIIENLKKNTTPDIVFYNLRLTMCSSQNDLDTAEKVVSEMKATKIERDWMTYSIMTGLYTSKGLKDRAASTLKKMENKTSRKTRAAYSSLITWHANLGNKEDVHRIWTKMKPVFRKPNDSEYTSMISSLIKLGDLEAAEKIYTDWESKSSNKDSRIPNLLLAAYINKNQMENAQKFYDRLVKKGVKPSYTTWELLSWGYLKWKQMKLAVDCFEKAVVSVKKWKSDVKFIRKVFENLEEQGDIDGAEKMVSILREAGCLTTEIYNMLLRTYIKAVIKAPAVAERMKNDSVALDEETYELLRRISEVHGDDV